MQRSFSPACERNKEVIFEVLKSQLGGRSGHLLEVGSGTGQHAAYLAPRLPQLRWHTSDLPERHALIKQWTDEVDVLGEPLSYRIGTDPIPQQMDLLFTANTLHIISWELVVRLIEDMGESSSIKTVCIYGPFTYGGQFTSPSNEAFDRSLRLQNPESGIRSFEKVEDQMARFGFELKLDQSMPANNQMLVFER